MNPKDKQTAFAVAVMFSALFGWAMVSTADVQDAENAHREYCEMVALWEADAAMNVEPAQRRGWPDFEKRKCK